MFERRKSITVKGVTFNMVLVEGDKFCIGEEEHEVDDFYMAEIPVTQELYMAVMGPAHTGSHNMMPDNFDYLDVDRFSIYGNVINHNESIEDYQKRIDKQWKDKRDREDVERARIVKLSASLPVNNVSWLEALDFIKRLNELTGLNFGMPSFEQWYFAAIGGIESKGYAFAGSDDANAVGHFHKLSTIVQSQGLFVMDDKSNKSKKRHEAKDWYIKPGSYLPNELGLYDMSGLVYEWLDEAGKVIGGSFHSNPDNVCKNNRFGYTDFRRIDSCLNGVQPIISCLKSDGYTAISGNLFGFRLILGRSHKNYVMEPKPHVKAIVSDIERHFIETVYRMPEVGLLRSIIANKYEKPPTIRRSEKLSAFSEFDGNIYHIFVCPQNITSFAGDCFNKYLSRRKFVSHCKETFITLLNTLSYAGYNLLIHDELGLNLQNFSYYVPIQLDMTGLLLRNKADKTLSEVLKKYCLITNDPDIIQIGELPFIDKYDYIRLSSNTIIVEIRDTLSVGRIKNIQDEFLSSIEIGPKRKHDTFRISLNCFCNFNNEENDFIGVQYPDGFQTKGLVRFIKEKISNGFGRINNEDFDNTSRVNWLFCKQNMGGLYEYNYPPSSGQYEILDERFFILPQTVHSEWSKSLKE
jgi:formylglycine-generating enzyme required for sulfatase activity